MNLEVIKFLIQNGADKTWQNPKGETVYDLVKKHPNSEEILNILNNTRKPNLIKW